MFSKTCEYAIRAIIFIAQQTQDGSRVGVKAIAKGIDSPEYFIAKILQDLSRKGFVQSVKGPNGGFFLNEVNLQMPLSRLVREIDGDRLFTACALGLKQCSATHPCPLHHEFALVKSGYVRILEESLIGDLAMGVNSNLTFLKA